MYDSYCYIVKDVITVNWYLSYQNIVVTTGKHTDSYVHSSYPL